LQDSGKWKERSDVWIKFLDRKGNLTVGYGSPGCIGPELEFGNTVGDKYEQPVLIIKTAWGGRSLYRDFRPPSSGLPAEEVLAKMLEDTKKRKADATMEEVKELFGKSYREMLTEVKGTLENLKAHFPQYQGQGYELAGLVWFQGWNDMISPEYTAEYTKNMENFIRDVRKDLAQPKLPFVIGQMGVDGAKANKNVQTFKEAQAKAAEPAEFQGNVKLVKTDVYWDTVAQAVFDKGWREHVEEWNKVGSDYPYHYLGSVKTMSGIGKAFGHAMLELRGEPGKDGGENPTK
jgi:alpha-galactosidase